MRPPHNEIDDTGDTGARGFWLDFAFADGLEAGMYRRGISMTMALSLAFAVASATALLAGCGTDTTTATPATSTAHGTLALDPPLRIASVDAATFTAQIKGTSSGGQLLTLAGAPICGVDFYYITFWTTGAAGETTKSSGALMVPTGAAPTCSGPHPIVLYSHGTAFEKNSNIADITNPSNSEGALIATVFAAQGFIVVAPNYAGYDISTLGYHPFLNASQQSGEMIDALTAARTALPNTFASATTDSGKLLITGYSEGGYVAMATERALELSGQTVTAAAPMSGPYALEALFDAAFFGNVNLGSTLFTPLVTTSYQRAYNNVYTTPSDFYSSTYATGIDTLMPTTLTPYSELFTQGLLPQTALFDSTTPVVPGLTTLLAVPSDPTNPLTPLFAAGFGSPYLINNSARVAYAVDAAGDPDGTASGTASLAASAPSNGLRLDLYKNDMRNGGWAPSAPTLLCGGENDPTVFFKVDTLTMAAFWSSLPAGLVSVLDVDPIAGPSGPYAPIQAGFQASQVAEFTSLVGSGLTAAQAQEQLVQSYHGTSVPPFCSLAARTFFIHVLSSP
jgi:acetyl esterase/lipase